jgi:hypothetical protein
MFERIDAIIDERIKEYRKAKYDGASSLISLIRRHPCLGLLDRAIHDKKNSKEARG